MLLQVLADVGGSIGDGGFIQQVQGRAAVSAQADGLSELAKLVSMAGERLPNATLCANDEGQAALGKRVHRGGIGVS